ncbi:hypothetical protein [Corynebacterium mastitidis]|uniref:hypothetical protein n=1 Tax=Corynebacterium mastitidis TaxID=161890 RepID=UPI000381BC65|nr:hypothetical protein [Corynebacterium mastitidis]
MFALIDKASDYIYPLFMAAVAACLGTGALVQASLPADPHAVAAPVRWASAAALCAVLLVLAERLVPLRGLSRGRWVWRYRRRRRLPGVDRAMLVQVALSAVAGAFLGAAAGHGLTPAAYAAAATAAARIAVGVACGRGREVPGLLAAGRTRALMEGIAGLQDTELVSDLLVMNWLRGSARRSGVAPRRRGSVWAARGTGPWALGLRRLRRRGYLPWAAAAVLIWQLGLAPAYGGRGVLVTAVAWGFVCAAAYRAADFGRLGVASPARWGYLVACAVAGAVVLAAQGRGAAEVAAVALVWVFVGRRRGRPNRVRSTSFFDSGMGVSFSPEVVRYYARGLLPILPLGLLLY